MLDKCCAAFHPVAAVQVKNTLDVAHLRAMNMAAYNAIEAAPHRFGGERGLNWSIAFTASFTWRFS
jgi:hypothetical protein